MKELGLFGMSIPEEYGGIGLNAVGKATILEQLGRTHNGFVSLISAHTGIGSTGLVKLASDHLKQKYLPDMAVGKKIARSEESSVGGEGEERKEGCGERRC